MVADTGRIGVKCSRNELTALMYKAAVGSGCAIAVADEIARAACALQCLGYEGVGLFLSALDASNADLDIIRQQDSTPARRFSTVTIAQQGPSVFDALHVKAQADQTELPVYSIDIPFLLVGLAVERSAEQLCCYKISYSNGTTALIGHDGISVAGEIPEQPCDGRLSVITDEELSADLQTPLALSSAVEVDNRLWDRCHGLAGLTYVPSTEASRLAGAGAGLTDND